MGTKANAISGGQHTRLLLGRALIEQQITVIDEPSNHLDLPTLIWLGNFLQSWKVTSFPMTNRY